MKHSKSERKFSNNEARDKKEMKLENELNPKVDNTEFAHKHKQLGIVHHFSMAPSSPDETARRAATSTSGNDGRGCDESWRKDMCGNEHKDAERQIEGK